MDLDKKQVYRNCILYIFEVELGWGCDWFDTNSDKKGEERALTSKDAVQLVKEKIDSFLG